MITSTQIVALMAHIRAILSVGTEVREVYVGADMVTFYADTQVGVGGNERVEFMCSLDVHLEEGRGWEITAYQGYEHKFVGEWVAQGVRLEEHNDHLAAWFGVSVNDTGGSYWLRSITA